LVLSCNGRPSGASAPRAKEFPELCAALIGQQPSGDLNPMIEEVRIRQLHDAPRRAALGVGSAVDNSPDPSVIDGSHAHHAGLQRHIEGGLHQSIIP